MVEDVSLSNYCRASDCSSRTWSNEICADMDMVMRVILIPLGDCLRMWSGDGNGVLLSEQQGDNNYTLVQRSPQEQVEGDAEEERLN